MDVRDFLIISRLINDCPNCGSDLIGDGEGSLEVKNNIIQRTCKCGFKFEYDSSNGANRKIIKKAISDALTAMKIG